MTKHRHHKNPRKGDQIHKIERGAFGSKQKKPILSLSFLGIKIFSFLFFVIPIILFLSFLVVFEIRHKDKFFPNIDIAGESVSEQTYDEALAHFKEKAEIFEKQGLTLNFESSKGIKNIKIPMSAVGVTSDASVEYFSLGEWEKDLHQAYDFGHGPNILRNLGEQFTLLFGAKKINFSGAVQEEAVNSFLGDEFYNFLKKSEPAGFVLIDNKVAVSKEVIGEKVDEEEVMNVLSFKVSQLDTTPVNFMAYMDTPKITKERLEPHLDNVSNFSKKVDLVFEYKGRKWRVAGTKIMTWFTLDDKDSIVVDRAKLETYLAGTVSKAIDSPPKNSRFQMKDGELIEIVAGVPGNALDIDKIVLEIEEIITKTNLESEKKIITIPAEIIKVEPKITKETIEKYYIKDLVGEIRTSFKGSSADREHNIKIGAGVINGMLIAPGAEFSTVAAIGRVTEKEGYVKETVIKENKTAKEFGGGLCQIATTLFRLALNAGLPISERMNHRFVIHYYDPPGLDATIYGPHPDFRFVNDTGGYLLLQARVEGKEVVMELYGQKDGRYVEISEPYLSNKIPAPPTQYIESLDIPVGQTKCFEASHDGLTTNVFYTVKYPDGRVYEKNFKSIYQPWQKKCFIGVSTLSSLVLVE